MIPPIVDQSFLDRPGVVVADVRWYLDERSGEKAYLAGHIPGAVFVDLDLWLAAEPAGARGGRHPLPDPKTFARGMESLGIGDGTTIVAYDDAGGVIAARLVWMLRALGEDAALLDGGLTAYHKPLETAIPNPTHAAFTPRKWPADHLATIADASSSANLVLDARPAARFRGEDDDVDPRAGHIPGAKSLPCRDHIGPDGRFLAPNEIRRRFVEAGVGPDTRVVSYCGSGVTACHNLLTMEWVGLGQGRLFSGSWSQYSADPDRPVATGE